MMSSAPSRRCSRRNPERSSPYVRYGSVHLVENGAGGGKPRYRPHLAMEAWSIELAKDYLKFSAAHFLIFADGTAERLHGHNYRIAAQIHSRLDQHGLVLNFKEIKPLIRTIADGLDEHFLIPGEHSELTCEAREEGLSEIVYRERRYLIPTEEIIVLPISNTSVENLASWVGRELLFRIGKEFPSVSISKLVVKVEETAGQWGVFTVEP